MYEEEGGGGERSKRKKVGKVQVLISKEVTWRKVLSNPPPPPTVLECGKQWLIKPSVCSLSFQTVETADGWARLLAIYLTGLIQCNFAKNN